MGRRIGAYSKEMAFNHFVLLAADCVEVSLGGDIECAVCEDRGTVDRGSHVHGADNFLLLARIEYYNLTVFGSNINLSICYERGAPDSTQGVVDPIGLSCLGI
jgi:hypothetical protein